MNPRTSIIVLSYRNPALIAACLRSLREHAAQPTEDYEWIIVDSASSVETRTVIKETLAGTNYTLLPFKENTGYTRGINEGLRVATGKYLALLNHDIVATPLTLHPLETYLAHHPRVGLAGPRLVNFDESTQPSAFRYYTPQTVFARRVPFLPASFTKRWESHFNMTDNPVSTEHPSAVDWLSGAALMTTRRALDSVGLLDERFFHYFSDVDWAHRFWENGLAVVYQPAAQLYHYLGRTSKGSFGLFDALVNRTTRWHIADGYRYFRTYGRHYQPHPTISASLL